METLSPQTPEDRTAQLVTEWFNSYQGLLDKNGPMALDIDRGMGPETVVLDDLVFSKELNTQVAVIEGRDGLPNETVNIDELLKWRKFSDKDISGELEQIKADKIAEAEEFNFLGNLAVTPEVDNISERDRQLFAPMKQPESIKKNHDDHDNLFTDSDEDFASKRSAEIAASRDKKVGELITEESERDAVEQIAKTALADHQIGDILLDYRVSHNNLGIEELPSAIRYDGDLRIAIGKYLQGKLERKISEMPPRSYLKLYK
jgi:hypothetical protein